MTIEGPELSAGPPPPPAGPAFCAQCGSPLPEGRFCANCGAPVPPSGAGKRRRTALVVLAVVAAVLVVAVATGLVLRRSGSSGSGGTTVSPSDAAAAATAAYNAGERAWVSGDVALDCGRYEGIGPNWAYASKTLCLSEEESALGTVPIAVRPKIAAMIAVPGKAKVLPNDMVLIRQGDIVAPDGMPDGWSDNSYYVMHLIPGQGWRLVGGGTAGGDGTDLYGYVPAQAPALMAATV
jgi:hypothetical protein